MSLDPDQTFAPPVPTWCEHLRSLGHNLSSEDEIDRVCAERGLALEDLDKRLNGFGWQDSWDNFTGPQAAVCKCRVVTESITGTGPLLARVPGHAGLGSSDCVRPGFRVSRRHAQGPVELNHCVAPYQMSLVQRVLGARRLTWPCRSRSLPL
jgi:hypothetical protein